MLPLPSSLSWYNTPSFVLTCWLLLHEPLHWFNKYPLRIWENAQHCSRQWFKEKKIPHAFILFILLFFYSLSLFPFPSPSLPLLISPPVCFEHVYTHAFMCVDTWVWAHRHLWMGRLTLRIVFSLLFYLIHWGRVSKSNPDVASLRCQPSEAKIISRPSYPSGILVSRHPNFSLHAYSVNSLTANQAFSPSFYSASIGIN